MGEPPQKVAKIGRDKNELNGCLHLNCLDIPTVKCFCFRDSDFNAEFSESLGNSPSRRGRRFPPSLKSEYFDAGPSNGYESNEKTYEEGRRDSDSAVPYNNRQRPVRRQTEKEDNNARDRDLAQDMEPLNDEPAPYETHSYDNPDVTRSYEVSFQRRPSLTDDLGAPRQYLHSDGVTVNARSAMRDGDGSGMRYDMPETYEKLNRGSAMTRQYRDPGREFFRSHPVGFEHFPHFDYVESERKVK